MSRRFVFLPPSSERTLWYADGVRQSGVDLEIVVCGDRAKAVQALATAAGAYGTMDAELLTAAPQLEWLACPAAGPHPSFYFPELIASDVTVTNMRGVYSDHISVHIMSYILAFARSLHVYVPQQLRGEWRSEGEGGPAIHLPETTALIIGVGGIGAATAVHCAHFGMRVVGIDPRGIEAPDGVAELHHPDALDEHLGQADFVIMTAPQTPSTQGLVDSGFFARMKGTAIFINIGRGANVLLNDLDRALRDGRIAGAALDVFETEPLPAEHPLWQAPNFLMTPHVAAAGPSVNERRIELLAENCRRFAAGDQLLNAVDKENWY